ncbi:MAG: dienelactone hydrolase family protein [Sphingomonadaceae bacterium]
MHDLMANAVKLYDEFTHVHLDRRRFFADLTKLAGGAAAAQSLAVAIAASPAAAALIEPEDKRVACSWITLPGAEGRLLKAYLAEPAGVTGPRPAVLVVHENRGLNAYIEDVARRLAVAGIAGVAVDFLSVSGGTPADEDQAREMIGALNLPAAVSDGVAAVKWLHSDLNAPKVGIVGFCWGGAMVNRVAVEAGDALSAGVAFYGVAPPPSEAAEVKAPLMLHYAGSDERVNAQSGAWVDALKAAGVSVTRHDYPGTQHAFHNDTSAARYDKDAAERAWERTIAFFKTHLT